MKRLVYYIMFVLCFTETTDGVLAVLQLRVMDLARSVGVLHHRPEDIVLRRKQILWLRNFLRFVSIMAKIYILFDKSENGGLFIIYVCLRFYAWVCLRFNITNSSFVYIFYEEQRRRSMASKLIHREAATVLLHREAYFSTYKFTASVSNSSPSIWSNNESRFILT